MNYISHQHFLHIAIAAARLRRKTPAQARSLVLFKVGRVAGVMAASSGVQAGAPVQAFADGKAAGAGGQASATVLQHLGGGGAGDRRAPSSGVVGWTCGVPRELVQETPWGPRGSLQVPGAAWGNVCVCCIRASRGDVGLREGSPVGRSRVGSGLALRVLTHVFSPSTRRFCGGRGAGAKASFGEWMDAWPE